MNILDTDAPEMPIDDGPMVLTPKLPYRGMGWCMLIIAGFGLLLMAVARFKIGLTEGVRVWSFYAITAAITLAFLLGGIHLIVRKLRTTIDDSLVTFDRVGVFGPQQRVVQLRDYVGLRRYTMKVTGVDTGAIAGALAGGKARGGLLGSTVAGTGGAVKTYFLELRHQHDPSLNVLLAVSRTASSINWTAKKLQAQFDLPLISTKRNED